MPKLPALRHTLRALTPLALLLTLYGIAPNGFAQRISVGPLLGYNDMREVAIWVQTDQEASVAVRYTPASGSETRTTPAVATTAKHSYTATLRVGPLMPGTEYRYTLVLNGRALDTGGTFRTLEYFRDRRPPPDVTFALLSGHYANETALDPPYRQPGGGYQIFDTVLSAQPDACLWLGNTTFLREPDFYSVSGIRERFASARDIAPLRALLAGAHHYATRSQGDFGPAGADSRYFLAKASTAAFRDFWPGNYHGDDAIGATATRFRWSDAEFFILDTFANRTIASGRTKTILGEAQISWLLNALTQSNATFKFICAGNPILSPVDHPDNLAAAGDERTAFLERLTETRVSGIVFLTGGRRFGEVTKYVRGSGYDLFDITTGPVTADPDEASRELNYFRVPGSLQTTRNAVLLSITGAEGNRSINITYLDTNGNELWSETIIESQLKPRTSRFPR